MLDHSNIRKARPRRYLALTALAAMCSPVVAAQSTRTTQTVESAAAASPKWEVVESVTPLSGARRVTAVLESTEPLTNMIGQPQQAGLVLRCQEGVLAAYVSWPEVLQLSGSTFGGRAQTMVLWKLDDNPIEVSFWLRDNAGVAAGKFETKPAVKLLERLITGRRLVVRLTGQTTQDAVFDLGDIAAVAAKVGAPCGVKWTMPR